MVRFNPQQEAALLHPIDASHLLLLAGAGSGKTAVLVHRLKHLLDQSQHEIWCLTFTRKAALEMRERFALLLNDTPHLKQQTHRVQLQTFHIFARDIIQAQGAKLPESLDQWLPLATKILQSGQLQHIRLPQVILVDEFQDINPEQLEFCQALRVLHLFAVGDDDQAIYGFRGSDSQVILNLEQYFHPIRTLYLTQNYRSHQLILNLANQLFQKKSMFKKSLQSQKTLEAPWDQQPEKPQWLRFNNSMQQIDWMITKIQRLKRAYPQLKWSDFAILVRLNRLVQYYQEALEGQGVQVMTIHASKGLQFPIVFIADLNQGLFPHFESFNTPLDHEAYQQRLQEEERLLYVAITRAESKLYLLHCRERVWRGHWTRFQPSVFFQLKLYRKSPMVTLLKIRCVIMVLGFMLVRMVMFLPMMAQSQEKRSEWILKHSKIWAPFVFRFLNFKLHVRGAEHLTQAQGRHLFVVSNHLSWADIPALIFGIPHQLGFVAKMELGKIPILNYWMKQIGCILVDRKKHREAMRALKQLESQDKFTRIVLFPEGTRSRDGRIGSFKPGGLKMAWQLGALVQPIHLQGTRNSWEERKDTTLGEGHLSVLPPMDLKAMRADGVSFDQFLESLELLLKQENKDL